MLEFIDNHQLGADDTIVLLGDVGLNFYGDRLGDGMKKKMLNKKGVTIFCIHGNHEKRPQTISSYKEKQWNGGIVFEEDTYPNLKFAKDGEVYDLDGFKTVVIGGAYSVDKYIRLRRNYPWFSDEQPSKETKAFVESKLDELGWKIDIVLSHTCPAKYIPVEAFIVGLSQDEVDRSTEDWLDCIEDKLSYKTWYCGHWHINKRIDKIHFLMECKETLF